MIEDSRIQKILYGGDYNPEQWPEEIWQEDMRLFHLAHIDVVTLNVFSWASLQLSDDVYDFSRLDRIMDLAEQNDLKICLATSTGAHPAWMARKYPEILRVNEQGIRRNFGSRHNSCPSSPIYRKFSTALADKLADRYKNRKNLIGWHVSNEYGGMCYCDKCAGAFREWLKKRYQTLEELNRAWNTAFWSHTFYDWEEIPVPDQRSEEFYFGGNLLKTNFQGISLDYRRFMSDAMQECYRLEYDAIKKHTPDLQITTNLMGTYPGLDYRRWAKDMDFISWDNYPTYDARPFEPAMQHDVMRGVGGGKPFALMEQTPSVSNWHPYCALKRPGIMRLYSWQAVAHGADTVMFFQMRQSIGACEKYHGGLIGHRNNEHTRVFSEMTALGAELEKIGNQTLGGRTPAQAAIVFDWSNWWATQLSAGPSILINYLEEIKTWYQYFWNNNIPVDIIGTEDSLSPYKIVVAPMLYMCPDSFAQRISDWTSAGGAFLTSYFSGYVDEHDLVVMGGYPGFLKKLLGIWVEESDALPPQKTNSFLFSDSSHSASVICDLIHPEGAEVLAVYDQDFYAGMPVVTRNQAGKGSAWYIATHADDLFYQQLLDQVCAEQNVLPLARSSELVEITVRQQQSVKNYFALNHSDSEGSLVLEETVSDLLTDTLYPAGTEIKIAAKDVMILQVK